MPTFQELILRLQSSLRYCARPAFALERLREIDAGHLVYESVKPGSGGSLSVMLTPLELIERLAALIPPPRRHRHRYYYYCVLAPNVPRRKHPWGADHRLHHRGDGRARHARALGRSDHAAAPDAGPWPTAVGDAGRGEYEPQPQPAPDCEFDQRIAW